MIRTVSLLALLSVLLVIALACAPPPPRPVGTSPAANPPPAPTAQAVAPAPNPQDAAWEKIVQQGKKEGMLTFQASTTFAGDVGIAVTKAFKDKTGIRLEIVASRGGENYERIKTEKRAGQRVASLTQASGLYLLIMKNDGLLQPVTDLPSLRERDGWVAHPLDIHPDGHILSFYKTWISPYINTKQVKPDQVPQSLQDFLKPQWKGQMVISDPRTGSGTYWYYTTLARKKIIDWSYVKSLAQQDLQYERNASAAMDLMMRGVASANLIGFSTTSGVLVDAGAPIKAISLKEGDVFDISGFAMVEGAPHPNATRVFINWFLSREGLTVFANAAKQETLRKDTPNLLPKEVVPPDPNVPKIGITLQDLDEAEKLFREGFMPNLMGLKR